MTYIAQQSQSGSESAPDVATAASQWVGDLPTLIIPILIVMMITGVVLLVTRMRGGGPHR